MRKFLSFFSLFLISSMLFTVLSGCAVNDNENENGDIDISGIDITGYTIVRPDGSSTDLTKATASLKEKILENAKVALAVAVDSDEESEYEILLGETNRNASKEALEELKAAKNKNAYIVKVTEKKVVIVGLTEDDTLIGLTRFMRETVEKSEHENTIPLEIGYSKIRKTGDLLYYSPEAAAAIVLESTSVIDKPKYMMETTTYPYGKIIKLEHQADEKNNGILLTTCENFNGHPWHLFRSDDDGNTWTTLPKVIDEVNGDKPSYQPYLYELPVDMGKYKAGTILFSACARRGAEEQTIIILQVTNDFGQTWEPVGEIAVGGSYSEGIWEPVLEFEDGKLYCLYSDQSHPDYSQKLVYKYTTDLETWSEKCDMVANTEFYAGMVALTKMGDGRWALAFEGPDWVYVSIKFADSLDSWDVTDMGEKVVATNGGVLASAPAIVWTPDGGECGTLILTANDDNDSAGTETKCGFFLSFDYGKTWTIIENPLPMMANPLTRSGYSPGFFVDEEGTVYYVNNPEYFPDAFNEKFMMAKIKVY